MRIVSIDYETKTVTLGEDLRSPGPEKTLTVSQRDWPNWLFVTDTGTEVLSGTLREGMAFESDGVGKNGQLINPRRVK